MAELVEAIFAIVLSVLRFDRLNVLKFLEMPISYSSSCNCLSGNNVFIIKIDQP